MLKPYLLPWFIFLAAGVRGQESNNTTQLPYKDKFSVRVYDGQNNPLSGATVSLRADDGTTFPDQQTNDEGRVVFTGVKPAQGGITMRASKAGLQTKQERYIWALSGNRLRLDPPYSKDRPVRELSARVTTDSCSASYYYAPVYSDNFFDDGCYCW